QPRAPGATARGLYGSRHPSFQFVSARSTAIGECPSTIDSHLRMEKNLLKLLTVDREIRLFVVDVTKVLRFSALRAMRAEPARQLYVKIFANCALLRGLLTPEQRATVAVRFKPEGYSAHCEIDGRGAVHCLFSPKLCSFDGDVADLVGEGATLSITRGSWTGGMFTGTVELTQHAVDDFFSYFYSKSEQT